MRADRHVMPPEMFRALARGGGGQSAVRRLLDGQCSRNLLVLRELVELSAERGHPHADAARRSWSLLGELRRVHPLAVRRVLAYPSVSAWAAQALADLRAGEEAARPGMLAPVVAAAALRAGAALSVRVPVPPGGTIPLPTAGYVTLPAGSPTDVDLHVSPGRLTIGGVPRRPGPGWACSPRLRAGHQLDLRLDDLWSLCRGTAVRPPGPQDAAAWRASLAPGWRLLAGRHRGYAAELAAAITMLMPLPAGPPATADDQTQAVSARYVSGTFPAGVGCIALSGSGDDAPTTAATLVHELAHNKLAALANFFRFVSPGDDVLLPAPWRDSPRPLPALVQGLYAHVSVAEFWRRQRCHEWAPGPRLRARIEYRRLRAGCREVAELLLASGRLTWHGRFLVRQLHDVLSPAAAAGP